MTRGYKQLIIEFVRSHQYCLFQDIVDGLDGNISRVTISKLLKELQRDRIIVNQKTKENARDNKFYVREENPLVAIPAEIERFRQAYFDFLEKVLEEYHKQPNKLELWLHATLGIWFLVSETYHKISISRWTIEIKDRRILKQLYSEVYNQLANINLWLVENVPEVMDELRVAELTDGEYMGLLKRHGLETEFQAVLDSIKSWDLADELLGGHIIVKNLFRPVKDRLS